MSKYDRIRRVNPRTVFTTLDDQEIPFVPFSWDEHLASEAGLEQEYRESGEIIDCPQYKVTFAGGTSQLFDHDEKSILEAPLDTAPEDVERVIAEQAEVWAKYKDATARLEEEKKADMVNLVYTESLANIKLPDDTSWEESQRKKHIKIPTDPEEKRLHFINTVLLKYRSDQVDFMATVMGVSMGAVREADLDKVKDSFRDQIWGNRGQQLSGRNPAVQAQDSEDGQLDGELPLDAGQGSQGVANDQGAI